MYLPSTPGTLSYEKFAMNRLCNLVAISQKKSFGSFETFAPNVDARAKEFPKEFPAGQNSFADFEAKPKETKELKEFLEDIA